MFQLNGQIMNNAAELQKRVEQFKADAATPVQGPVANFGQSLKAAIKRFAPRSQGKVVASASDEESFGRKLVEATKRFGASRRPLAKSD
jgi:hypothetical protein